MKSPVQACVVLCALVFPLAAQAEPKYSVLRLGMLGEQSYDALNDLGQVAGFYQAFEFAQKQAALTRPNQPLNPATDLLTPLTMQNLTAKAFGVNDLGQAVGSYFPASTGDSKAFRTQPNAPVNDATDNLMPGFNPSTFGVGRAINNLGQATGQIGDFAFRSSANGEPLAVVNLGGLFGGGSIGFGINDLGQVTGMSAGRAFRTAPNQPIRDGDNLGLLGPSGISFGHDINNQGVVVGGSQLTSDGGAHAFRAIPGQPMEDLGTLNGSRTSIANAINEAGWIVGSSNVSPLSRDFFHAVLWHDGMMIDLNDLVPNDAHVLALDGLDINNQGQILIRGDNLNTGATELFLLSPVVPEPSSLAMQLGAILSLCALRAFLHN